MVVLGNDLIDTDRVEGRLIGYRENCLERLQRTKRDELTGCVGGRQWHGSPGEKETRANRCRGPKDWTDRRAAAAVIRRRQGIAAGQGCRRPAGSEERVSA